MVLHMLNYYIILESESTNISHIFNSLYFGDFPGGSVVKNLAANARDVGPIPGSGRVPGGGNGNTFQYSCLGNQMDRGAWRDTVHKVARVGCD